jgi:hypothetical protein
MKSKFNIEIEVLEYALRYMQKGGYLNTQHTIEDLEDFAYNMCEGNDWYVKVKIYYWAIEEGFNKSWLLKS